MIYIPYLISAVIITIMLVPTLKKEVSLRKGIVSIGIVLLVNLVLSGIHYYNLPSTVIKRNEVISVSIKQNAETLYFDLNDNEANGSYNTFLNELEQLRVNWFFTRESGFDGCDYDILLRLDNKDWLQIKIYEYENGEAEAIIIGDRNNYFGFKVYKVKDISSLLLLIK